MVLQHVQQVLRIRTWHKNVCKKRGFDAKIETQGGLGIENELTEDDVASADVVILAVSVVIEGEERFEGKKIINTDVNEAISNTAGLIDRAVELAKGE